MKLIAIKQGGQVVGVKSAAVKKRAKKNPAKVRAVSRTSGRTPHPSEFEVYRSAGGTDHDPKLGALLGRFPRKLEALTFAKAYADEKNASVVVVGK